MRINNVNLPCWLVETGLNHIRNWLSNSPGYWHAGRSTMSPFIRNGIDLFNPCPDVTMAKKHSKIFWDHRCVFSGRSSKELIRDNSCLDGAHLWPAGGDRKARAIRCYPANIFPMARTTHHNWDNLPSTGLKVKILLGNCLEENTQTIREILEELAMYL